MFRSTAGRGGSEGLVRGPGAGAGAEAAPGGPVGPRGGTGQVARLGASADRGSADRRGLFQRQPPQVTGTNSFLYEPLRWRAVRPEGGIRSS